MQIPERRQQKQFRAPAPPSVCRRTDLQTVLSSTHLEIKKQKQTKKPQSHQITSYMWNTSFDSMIGGRNNSLFLSTSFWTNCTGSVTHSGDGSKRRSYLSATTKSQFPLSATWNGTTCILFFPYLILLKDVGESSIMQWLRESESQRWQLRLNSLLRLLSFKAPSAGNCIHIKFFLDDSLWLLSSLAGEKTPVKEEAPSFFWHDSGSRTCCMNNASIHAADGHGYRGMRSIPSPLVEFCSSTSQCTVDLRS